MKWKMPEMWSGGEAWIIAGGSSMPRQFGVPEAVIADVYVRRQSPFVYSQYLQALQGRHVIGVNNAYQIGNWIDVLFFGDCSWYLVHSQLLAKWPGLKITCCPRFESRNKGQMEGLKFLAKDKEKHHGLTTDRTKVSWNNNSGAAAIGVAAHTGATRIYLLGFDMTLGPDGMSHWHGSHGPVGEKKKRQPPFARHLKGFPEIAKDAKAKGIEIINVNPDSAIPDFPKVRLKDVL